MQLVKGLNEARSKAHSLVADTVANTNQSFGLIMIHVKCSQYTRMFEYYYVLRQKEREIEEKSSFKDSFLLSRFKSVTFDMHLQKYIAIRCE